MSMITDTILQQLGGWGVLRAMLGARRAMRDDCSVQFDIQGCKKINRIKIEYVKNDDTYHVKFFRYVSATADLKIMSDYEGIYCDQLVNLIEDETQLFLSLSRREN